jgi:hypothetical protein
VGDRLHGLKTSIFLEVGQEEMIVDVALDLQTKSGGAPALA